MNKLVIHLASLWIDNHEYSEYLFVKLCYNKGGQWEHVFRKILIQIDVVHAHSPNQWPPTPRWPVNRGILFGRYDQLSIMSTPPS